MLWLSFSNTLSRLFSKRSIFSLVRVSNAPNSSITWIKLAFQISRADIVQDPVHVVPDLGVHTWHAFCATKLRPKTDHAYQLREGPKEVVRVRLVSWVSRGSVDLPHKCWPRVSHTTVLPFFASGTELAVQVDDATTGCVNLQLWQELGVREILFSAKVMKKTLPPAHRFMGRRTDYCADCRLKCH